MNPLLLFTQRALPLELEILPSGDKHTNESRFCFQLSSAMSQVIQSFLLRAPPPSPPFPLLSSVQVINNINCWLFDFGTLIISTVIKISSPLLCFFVFPLVLKALCCV